MDRIKQTIKGVITPKEKKALDIVINLMGELSLETEREELYEQVDKSVHCLATEWNYVEEFLCGLIKYCDIEEEDS